MCVKFGIIVWNVETRTELYFIHVEFTYLLIRRKRLRGQENWPIVIWVLPSAQSELQKILNHFQHFHHNDFDIFMIGPRHARNSCGDHKSNTVKVKQAQIPFIFYCLKMKTKKKPINFDNNSVENSCAKLISILTRDRMRPLEMLRYIMWFTGYSNSYHSRNLTAWIPTLSVS